MKKPELLAPAGDMECLETAANFGADAVYIGGEQLQLRSGKAAFGRQEIRLAADFLHSRGKKLYVAVNCFADNREVDAAGEYAAFLQSAGADAVICSDLGVMAAVREAAPALELHVSTQANCMNHRAAALYASLGARRIVLARELSLADIAELRRRLPAEVELEGFVHGAMCMAYSGRCLISSFLTARSGNRGACTQPCRWNYALVEEKRPGQYFPIEEAGGQTAILSSHDLCCIGMLDRLAEAGVSSLKIEGRMRSVYYVATVVGAYRKVLDGLLTPEQGMQELESLQHRPFSTGFYLGEERLGHFNDGSYTDACRFIAKVLRWENGVATVEQRNHFRMGDRLERLSPTLPPESFCVTDLVTLQGERRDTAPHPREILQLRCPLPLSPGDLLRRREPAAD